MGELKPFHFVPQSVNFKGAVLFNFVDIRTVIHPFAAGKELRRYFFCLKICQCFPLPGVFRVKNFIGLRVVNYLAEQRNNVGNGFPALL